MGISVGFFPETSLKDVERGKCRLLFASAEDALAKDFLASLKNEKSVFHQNFVKMGLTDSLRDSHCVCVVLIEALSVLLLQACL